MKEIRLDKLVLSNFQGGSVVIDAECEDLNIFAANAAGKTRLASAFSWLLFNKDSLGRSDFSIKTIGEDGEVEHGVVHSVEGTLMADGAKTVLKKSYSENWVKKRGQ